MGLSISEYSSLFQNYRIPNIPEVQTGTVDTGKETTQAAVLESAGQTDSTRLSEVQNPAPKNADLENVSLKFNTGEDYSYIGKDKDLANLDMQKAISDMKKDSVLQQYQYFVGTAGNLMDQSIVSNEDGIVVPKFNLQKFNL